MISMLFETGHPWITFKDACNVRYTNQHVGIVHSSNLCTEITLHTNDNEIAVCNLGSVNLANHIRPTARLITPSSKTPSASPCACSTTSSTSTSTTSARHATPT
jgi:hypothetical protein